ncbi:hypothetical protein NPIL_494891 [Nephila pilipes]|uniref:Uncharacterized protein n=1 Tax=Nephila pilipes TaxID=299642 RepID=A0A8X6USC6_NEPPI|nr:hypothetical protein NPIL_494891 [Nephila pilipes]
MFWNFSFYARKMKHTSSFVCWLRNEILVQDVLEFLFLCTEDEAHELLCLLAIGLINKLCPVACVVVAFSYA